MIKQFLHKSFSVLLAFLVLFSTVSFTIEKHFCGDILVDVSIFTEANKCAMEAFEMEQEAITKKTCCKDEIEIIKGQKELKLSSFDDLNFEQYQLLVSFAQSYLDLFEDITLQNIPHKHYSSPYIIPDILVLNQVFII